jgi:hypothetical protein
MGEASREIARGWSYEPSVENFVAAVREATGLLQPEPVARVRESEYPKGG